MKKFSEFITESKIDEALNGKTLIDMSKFSNMFIRERAETLMNTVLSFFKTINDMDSDEYAQYLGLSDFKENLDKAIGEFNKTFYSKVYPEYNKFIKDEVTYTVTHFEKEYQPLFDKALKKFNLKQIGTKQAGIQISGTEANIASFAAYIKDVNGLSKCTVWTTK